MTETHPDDSLLFALALDDIDDAARDEVLRHLGSCHRCRSEYDALSATVEQTLAAAPAVEPRPGFDAKVLGAMGLNLSTTFARRRWAPRRWQLVAASLVAGMAIGVGGSYTADQLRGESTTLAQNSAFLETPTGEHVGTVTRTTIDDESVFVVSVHDGRAGMQYRCVLRLADGEQVARTTWKLTSERPETWVLKAPDQPVSELLLVANDGAGPVWSTARL